MNRRQFTLALGATAALPNISVAAQSPIAKTLGAKSAQYAHLWGRGIAQARPDITAKTLSSILQIPDSLAHNVMQHLVKSNVIGATNAHGVYQTLNPNTGVVKRLSSTIDTSDIQKLAKQIMDDPDEPVPMPIEDEK